MAHFAKIENEIVTNVIVVNNEVFDNLDFPESEKPGQDFIESIGFEGDWKQTSYNGNFRANYAGIGYSYDEERDVFIPEQPFKSWLLNEEDYQWHPPTPMPVIEDNTNQNYYLWNEVLLDWQLIDPSL
jgi:hypothetical protein